MKSDQKIGADGFSIGSVQVAIRRHPRASVRRDGCGLPAHCQASGSRPRRLRDGGVRRTRSGLTRKRSCAPRAAGSSRMWSSSPAASPTGWPRPPGWPKAAGARIIDINMGCPAKRVIGGYAGSALMRDLDHACRLIEATVAGRERPRDGQDAARLGSTTRINAPELARRAEALGVKAVTVHGRTRQQFYKGKADWNAIAPVVEACRHSGDRQRRYRLAGGCPALPCRLRRRCRHGRPLRRSGALGSSARSVRRLQGRTIADPSPEDDDGHRHRALRGADRPLRREGRHPPCPQASRGLCGCGHRDPASHVAPARSDDPCHHRGSSEPCIALLRVALRSTGQREAA